MLTLDFDMGGLESKLDEIEKAVSEAIRPAAQAGAQVFYDEVKARAPRSEKMHFTKGKKKSYAPGTLQAAIYQAFDKEGSVPGSTAEYGISWNKKKAFYGRFVEFGTKRMPAHPFLRPSFEAVQHRAVDAVNERLKKELAGKL